MSLTLRDMKKTITHLPAVNPRSVKSGGVTASALEVSGLCKSFGKTQVLKEINLTIDSGEMVFVLGPSGSGKSTLLRCCNRLEEPDKGVVKLDGELITGKDVDLNAMRRRIGMVFQHFNLYPHLNARDNVTLALRKVLKLSRKQANERALVSLESVGLADKAEQRPSELSGGQQQRVAIARSLALEPSVMLFDEPTSSLDPELVGDVLTVLQDMKVRGMTMMVVSHEMDFAREAADRVIFMDGGSIVEQGAPEHLFSNPEHDRTRAFLSRYNANSISWR